MLFETMLLVIYIDKKFPVFIQSKDKLLNIGK